MGGQQRGQQRPGGPIALQAALQGLLEVQKQGGLLQGLGQLVGAQAFRVLLAAKQPEGL